MIGRGLQAWQAEPANERIAGRSRAPKKAAHPAMSGF